MEPPSTEAHPLSEILPSLRQMQQQCLAAVNARLALLRRGGGFDVRAKLWPSQVRSELGSLMHSELARRLADLAARTPGLELVPEKSSKNFQRLRWQGRHWLVLRTDYKNAGKSTQQSLFREVRPEEDETTTVISAELSYPADLVVKNVELKQAQLVPLDRYGEPGRGTSLLPPRVQPVEVKRPPVVRPSIDPAMEVGRRESRGKKKRQE